MSIKQQVINRVIFDDRLGRPDNAPLKLRISEDLDDNVMIDAGQQSAPVMKTPDPSTWMVETDQPAVADSIPGHDEGFTLFVGKKGESENIAVTLALIDNKTQEVAKTAAFNLADHLASVEKATQAETATASQIDDLEDLAALMAKLNAPGNSALEKGNRAAENSLKKALAPLAKANGAFLSEFRQKFDSAFMSDIFTASLIKAFKDSGGTVEITTTTPATSPKRYVM